jgi:hypothetical protein
VALIRSQECCTCVIEILVFINRLKNLESVSYQGFLEI